MSNRTFFKTGEVVFVTYGKHSGRTGTVEHSDKSITTVRFGTVVEPVWTKYLEVTQ